MDSRDTHILQDGTLRTLTFAVVVGVSLQVAQQLAPSPLSKKGLDWF